MYKSVIDIRKDVPNDVLKILVDMADNAFNNRAGKLRNTSVSPYRFIYEGGEREYGCLQIGMLSLEQEKDFLHCVSAWQWVDDDPNESCDVLEEFATPVR